MILPTSDTLNQATKNWFNFLLENSTNLNSQKQLCNLKSDNSISKDRPYGQFQLFFITLVESEALLLQKFNSLKLFLTTRKIVEGLSFFELDPEKLSPSQLNQAKAARKEGESLSISLILW